MRIYVCSPYRADTPEGIEMNVAFARECCRAIFDAGHDPYASHLLFPQFCDDGNDAEREKCMEAAKRELLLCDGVMAFGESWSEGMAQEVSFADSHGVPVHSSSRDGLGMHINNAILLFAARCELFAYEQSRAHWERNPDRKPPSVSEWRLARNFLWGDLP